LFQSQRTDFSESTRENSREFNAYQQEVSTTTAHTENQQIITSPSDVSFIIKINFFSSGKIIIILPKQDPEKRVVFNEDDEFNEEEENDKRPVSKLHRRDTPHHLKNKRVQQHLNDKAANVILSKLKEMPHEASIDESPQVEMNPMPLVQDVGLPLVDDNGHIVDVNPKGIEISANLNGE
jgi:hypothetical protein